MTHYQEMLEECRRRIGPAPRRLPILSRLTYLRIKRPKWVKHGDKIKRLFDVMPELLQKGEVVWGCILQANPTLYDKGKNDAPGRILYCPDPMKIIDPTELDTVARDLLALMYTAPEHAEMQDIVGNLENENATPYGVRVPRMGGQRHSLLISTIFFSRKHIPQRRLRKNYLPILIFADKPKYAMPLPEKYWPEKLLEHWES
jgi:hypothetical protein